MKRREKYPLSHLSIAALMAQALPEEGPEEIVRRKARDYVSWAKSRGWSGPAFDPEILAGLLGISVEQTEDEIEGDGRIFPRRGRTVIQYRAGKPIERQRFTIFHEIAHTFFPDVFEVVRCHTPAVDDDAAHKAFENLCDVGAAELMMPQVEFSTDLETSKFCLQHAESLRSRYAASFEATLKRMLDLTPHSCAAVFLTDESFGDFSSVPGCVRVRWMWKSTGFKGFIKAGTLLPRGVCLPSKCDETCKPFPRGRDTWWIDGRPLSWYVETVRLPPVLGQNAYPKVIALLHSRLP